MRLRHFYRIAVNCFLTTIALAVTLNVAVAVWPDRFVDFFNSLPFLVRLPIGILGAFSAFGILTLWIAMIPSRLDYPEVAAQEQADGCVLRYHRCGFRL